MISKQHADSTFSRMWLCTYIHTLTHTDIQILVMSDLGKSNYNPYLFNVCFDCNWMHIQHAGGQMHEKVSFLFTFLTFILTKIVEA